MDCGPAALTCLLEGFGIQASYPRLQEACHLDLDGTSIDTLEQIAGALGLDVEQVMLPVDHLLLTRPPPCRRLLSSAATTCRTSWSPGDVTARSCRSWIPRRAADGSAPRRSSDELYVHRQQVPAARVARMGAAPANLSRRLSERMHRRELAGGRANALVSGAPMMTAVGDRWRCSMPRCAWPASWCTLTDFAAGRDAGRVIATHRPAHRRGNRTPARWCRAWYWSVVPDDCQ